MIEKLNKSCIICGLCRDCESALKRNIKRVEKLRTFFSDSTVIIIENDSKDNTKEILKEWKDNTFNFILNSFDTSAQKNKRTSEQSLFPATSKNRIQRMTDCRNLYLEIIKKNKLKSDFIIIIDMDLDRFYETEIISAITQAPSDWVALFANGAKYSCLFNLPIFKKYYDTYAYVPSDWDGYETTYKEQWLNGDLIQGLLKSSEYIPCKSAFGGIGIYKYDAIVASKYIAFENKKSPYIEVCCEHISVNLHCLTFGQNYICRNMKTMYQKMPFNISMVLSNKRFVWLWEKIKNVDFESAPLPPPSLPPHTP